MSRNAEVNILYTTLSLQQLVDTAIDSFGDGNGLPVDNDRGWGTHIQDAETDMVTQVNAFLTTLKKRIDEAVDEAEDISSFINGQGNTGIYDIANV